MRTLNNNSLESQMVRRTIAPIADIKDYDGDLNNMISTGSTLLDLAISGGRIHGGGIPGKILMEIFGPSGSGKTVLLAEIAGDIQRKGGQVKFRDPEARLDKQFAAMFGFNIDMEKDYARPDTVPELFSPVRSWKPKNVNVVNGYFGDSLAALSTDQEMDEKDGMGMRRAKEFSEECRKTCRVLDPKNILMVCSNQVREVIGATEYQVKYSSPGGVAIGFYASLRLRTMNPVKIKKVISSKIESDDDEEKEKKAKKKNPNNERIIGVQTTVEVFKSSVWKPFRSAPVTIIYDYGIDDIRENLQFVKEMIKSTTYTLNGVPLSSSMDKAISIIEDEKKEKKLKEQVIALWEENEVRFDSHRKAKVR